VRPGDLPWDAEGHGRVNVPPRVAQGRTLGRREQRTGGLCQLPSPTGAETLRAGLRLVGVLQMPIGGGDWTEFLEASSQAAP